MKITASALLLAAVLLAACSDDAPRVVLSNAQADYFGTWEHVGSEYGNNVVSDNMLLVIHPDSSVSYKRCITRMNGHNYTSFSEARIVTLDGKQLVIKGGVAFIQFTRELPIQKAPYVEADESYLVLDGLKLRRLKAGESSTHESWKCHSDDA